MGERTGIAWTDHTFNPWWGCTKVSPGCTNCYAEGEARRRGHEVWGPRAARRSFGQAHWDQPLRWNWAAEKEGRRHRVFCASMADVFERVREVDGADTRDYIMENERHRLFGLIDRTPWLDWQLLTKRPENFHAMLPPAWRERPPGNVWLGVSAEDQERADERIPILLRTPAAVRFVSAEPLLGPVDFAWVGRRQTNAGQPEPPRYEVTDALRGRKATSGHKGPWVSAGAESVLPRIDWVIVGGESGHRARPCDIAWVQEVIRQCDAAGVRCFVKQLGRRPYFGDVSIPWPSTDPKGANPDEWPLLLRVQQFPATCGTGAS